MNKSETIKLALLQNYFTFQGNVATLKLVYHTFDELVNTSFGDERVHKLNDRLFSDICEAVSLLPRKYKLNLHIVIQDYGRYQKAECEKIIMQNVHLALYQTIKSHIKKTVVGFSLIGIGALILLVSYLLRNQDLWFDLINISGTLFVWEGVSAAFIERNLENKTMKALAKAIDQITIDDGKTVPTHQKKE